MREAKELSNITCDYGSKQLYLLIFVPYAAVHDILHAPPIICWLIFRSTIFQNKIKGNFFLTEPTRYTVYQ